MTLVHRRIKQVIDAAARSMGVHVRRLSRQPEHNLLGLCDQPIGTVIDVGANAGQFARKARRIFPNAQLFCFEPLPSAFKSLDEWAQRQSGHVICKRSAIGDRDGTVEIHEHLDHPPSSSILKSVSSNNVDTQHHTKTQLHSVEILRLDTYFKTPGLIDGRTLLKVDVQGYELPVLYGATETLKDCQYVLAEVSLTSSYVGQPDFADIVNHLRQHRLHFSGIITQALDQRNVPVYLDALFSRPN